MKSDQRLLREYVAGSEEAFATLFDRHHASLYRFAYHLLGNPQEAEDLAQSTWMEAIRSLGSYQGRASFRTWLHAIALRLCRQRRRKHRVSTEPLGEQACEAADPQEMAERAETALAVQKALAGLAPEFREVLILHEIQGFKYREIAEILNRPIGTVKSRLHYATAALRAALEETRASGEESHDLHTRPAES